MTTSGGRTASSGISTQALTPFAKAGRERKVPIDYLRNNRTTRGLRVLTGCAPRNHSLDALEWRELGGGTERWTLLTVPQRLKRSSRIRGPGVRLHQHHNRDRQRTQTRWSDLQERQGDLMAGLHRADRDPLRRLADDPRVTALLQKMNLP